MLSLTLNRCIKKCLIALVFVMLWRYFINQALDVVRDGFFVLGVIFLVLVWFSYLGLDGIEAPWRYLAGRSKRQKAPRKRSGDMIDYVEEDVVTLEELSDDERHICGIISNLLAGLIYLIPALLASLFVR